MTIQQLIVLAIVVESVWETSKLVWQKGKISVDRIGALVVGLLIALTVRADIIALLGFEEYIPFVGVVTTGILISRGGNIVHDILEKISNFGGE